MKKHMLDIAIVLTVVLAMCGSVSASTSPPPGGTAPDSCTTSLLLAGIAGGLGLVRKFVR